jgi:hypothetical protein
VYLSLDGPWWLAIISCTSSTSMSGRGAKGVVDR